MRPSSRARACFDRLHSALVHDPEFYLPCIEPWLHNAFGIDLSDGHRFAVNQWRKANFTPIDLMSPPQELLLLDYATITDPNISVDFTLAPEAPGEAHGFLVWFDAELAPGIGFSNIGRCLAESAPDAFVGSAKAHIAPTANSFRKWDMCASLRWRSDRTRAVNRSWRGVLSTRSLQTVEFTAESTPSRDRGRRSRTRSTAGR